MPGNPRLHNLAHGLIGTEYHFGKLRRAPHARIFHKHRVRGPDLCAQMARNRSVTHGA